MLECELKSELFLYLRHFELIEFPVQRYINIIPDKVTSLSSSPEYIINQSFVTMIHSTPVLLPERHALLGDVDGLSAGPCLTVHPDLQIGHVGDLVLELTELVIQLSSPELNISCPQLELCINLNLVLVNSDFCILNQGFSFFKKSFSC